MLSKRNSCDLQMAQKAGIHGLLGSVGQPHNSLIPGQMFLQFFVYFPITSKGVDCFSNKNIKTKYQITASFFHKENINATVQGFNKFFVGRGPDCW